MYKNVGDINEIIKALDDNNLFSLTFERMQHIVLDEAKLSEMDRNEIIRGIVQNVPFQEVFEWILEADYLEHPFLGDDIVQCMFPDYNKNNENIVKIYECVNFQPHGDEKPVFFVDTSITGTRSSGLLVTTKGLYRKGKGMISLTAKMPVEVDTFMKELKVKHTCVLSYNGSRAAFEDIVELFQIVYIFNTLRYQEGEKVEEYVSMFSIDEKGELKYNDAAAYKQSKKKIQSDELNDSGVGQGSNPSMFLGVIFWIVIIVLISKGCTS